VPGGTRVLHTAEPYVQVTWALGPLQLSPGARVTASERWGTVFTPRVATLWRPVPTVGLRAAVGRGYRAPDFKELYLSFVNAAAGYAVRGNPDLQPETATNLTVGLEWLGRTVYARAGGFSNRYRDFIETGAPDATGTFTFRNVARGSTRGVELEAGLTGSRWRLESGYAYLYARDETTAAPLLGRPAHSARLGASLTLGGLRLGSTLLYTGPTPLRRDSSGRITDERAGFARLDLLAAARVRRSLAVEAGVENVFDRTLGDEWPGFTGRQVVAGLRWER
jgi:outer membrane receptor for ferrienterochelin and colicins